MSLWTASLVGFWGFWLVDYPQTRRAYYLFSYYLFFNYMSVFPFHPRKRAEVFPFHPNSSVWSIPVSPWKTPPNHRGLWMNPR